jgi:hypothetical protein
MKKLFTLLALVALVSLQSCTVTETTPLIDNDTISEVFEVTTNFNTANGYTKIVGLNPAIFASDVVLVYHLYDVVNGQDVWRPMQTYYIDNGAIDYNFDFTRNDVKIFMGKFCFKYCSIELDTNQTFRIVIVPGKFSSLIDKIIMLL